MKIDFTEKTYTFFPNYGWTHQTTMPIRTRAHGGWSISWIQSIMAESNIMTYREKFNWFDRIISLWYIFLVEYFLIGLSYLPMAWAKLAAKMWGWNTFTSTLMPTAFPPQMVPLVEMVDFPLSKVLPLQKRSKFMKNKVLSPPKIFSKLTLVIALYPCPLSTAFVQCNH